MLLHISCFLKGTSVLGSLQNLIKFHFELFNKVIFVGFSFDFVMCSYFEFKILYVPFARVFKCLWVQSFLCPGC